MSRFFKLISSVIKVLAHFGPLPPLFVALYVIFGVLVGLVKIDPFVALLGLLACLVAAILADWSMLIKEIVRHRAGLRKLDDTRAPRRRQLPPHKKE